MKYLIEHHFTWKNVIERQLKIGKPPVVTDRNPIASALPRPSLYVRQPIINYSHPRWSPICVHYTLCSTWSTSATGLECIDRIESFYGERYLPGVLVWSRTSTTFYKVVHVLMDRPPKFLKMTTFLPPSLVRTLNPDGKPRFSQIDRVLCYFRFRKILWTF